MTNNQKKTLVILAAGIGSRFGGGVKQITPVGPGGEIIIDYSIHDAIKAGFNKIIFIIRKDIEADFKDIIGNRIEELCSKIGVEVAYAYQNVKNVPMSLPGWLLLQLSERTKPLGTGHAILSCDGMIDGPFAVINADDYYGKEGFVKAAKFLDDNPNGYGLIGYILKNTLSENGGVSRGICHIEDGKLTGIKETHDIKKATDENGKDIAVSKGEEIDLEAIVSMNLWCLPEAFVDVCRDGIYDFLLNMSNPLKDEFLLPSIVDGLIQSGTPVAVESTHDAWFGVTYAKDKAFVTESFKKLYEAGLYNENLYSDII